VCASWNIWVAILDAKEAGARGADLRGVDFDLAKSLASDRQRARPLFRSRLTSLETAGTEGEGALAQGEAAKAEVSAAHLS
jgi:hypothetical protein